MRNLKRYGCLILLGLLMTLQASVVFAVGAISQGFQTNSTNITQGALVSQTSPNGSIVEPANGTTAAELVGVADNKPLIQLSGSGSVQVAVGGVTEALVSNINGPVSVGNKITASPLSGIGMKAVSSVEIVGTAQANLSSVHTVNRTVKNKSGSPVTVKVGLLPIVVNVAYYSVGNQVTGVASLVPNAFQSIANTISGHPVSPLRVLLASLLLVICSVIVITILYIAIRNGFISIGRNPLAQTALRKGLVDVILAAIGILVIAFVMTYAIIAT